ncbi:MAG: PspC domain-containing protein [Bacteroidetes bacterium]|nr:PspC domain-containing protein [Bacteroidota bacterium]
MKKTLTINISGIIFHIDEDAYDKLNKYLDKLKSHFHSTLGKEEIIADIEGRMAELLQDKITDSKQVITVGDISDVIGMMGEPGEFDNETEEPHEAAAPASPHGPKRLYRDPDGKMVGGVAAGLGAYFNLDPIWFRLAFLLIVFIGGSGLLIYFILWIALPEARSTAEKLAMKGESVNISNIEKSIKEEVSNLSDKLNDLTKKAKDSVKKKNSYDQNIFEQFLSLFITLIKVIFKIIVIVVGIVLLLTGISLIIAVLFALFGWGGPILLGHNEVIMLPLADFFGLLSISAGGLAILKIGLILFLGIPLLMLIYNAFRMIFNIERVRYLGITALNLWIAGLIITLFFSFRVAGDYRRQATFSKDLEIRQPISDTLFLSLNQEYADEFLYNSYDYIHAQEMHLIVTQEGIFYEQVELVIEGSENSEYTLTQFTTARGRSVWSAKERAEATQWHFEQMNSQLVFDPFFTLGERENWYAQQVWLKLAVPVGKYVSIDKNMEEILRWGRYRPYKLAGKTWIMTEKGLEDPDDAGPISQAIYIAPKTKSGNLIRPIMRSVVGLLW